MGPEHRRVTNARKRRRGGWSTPLRGGALAILAALPSACALQPARIAVGPDPLDPAVPVPAISPASSLGPYTSQRPVEPAPWDQTNRDVQPQPDTQ
jgi:hypothetical protein